MSNATKHGIRLGGRRVKWDFWSTITLVAILFAIMFICYPFLYLFQNALTDKEGHLTFEHVLKFFRKNYYMVCLTNTLKLAFWATILATLVGLPLAYISTRYNTYAKGFTQILIVISLMSPPFIGAYAWVLLMGNNGILTNWAASIGWNLEPIYGFKGMLMVFVLKLYPYVYLYAQGALQKIDSSLEEASESLGVHGFQRMMKVTFPVIMPTILNSMLMVFMTSIADYGTPMMLGKNYKVLTVAVYEEFMSEMVGDTSFASALAVMITLCTLLILIIQKTSIASKSYQMSALRPPKEREFHGFKRVLVSSPLYFVGIIGILPILVIVYTSFRAVKGTRFTDGFSLVSYQAVLDNMGRYIKNTFVMSAIAIVIVMIIGLLAAYLIVRRKSKISSLLDLLLMFPYVIPGSVIGISMVVAFNRRPLILTGTFFIIIMAYVIRKLPFTLRSSVGILYQIDPSIEEASISLGVPPSKTFFMTTAPQMLPGLFSGAILSFIEIINELSCSMILYTGKTQTIAVAIFNSLFRDAYGTAAALATILTVVTVLALMLFNKLTGGKGYVS